MTFIVKLAQLKGSEFLCFDLTTGENPVNFHFVKMKFSISIKVQGIVLF